MAVLDPLVLIGLVLAAIAATAAVMVVIPTRRAGRSAAVARELDRFRRRYQDLRDRQVTLGNQALQRAPMAWRATSVPLLTLPGWIFERPQDISVFDLILDPKTKAVDELLEATHVMRGMGLSGNATYSEVIFALNPNAPYFDGIIYRPTDIAKNAHGGISMTFAEGKYFDYLDTSEVLAYEALLHPKDLGVRRRLTDPFNLMNRVASLGVVTLTIRKSAQGSTFLMHKRSGQFVVADRLYHVVPAGEFAPSDVGLAAVKADFDLWRNIMREYAEELLGMPDAQGQGGRRLDYAGATPYREMNEALANNALLVRTFGLGLDPVTFKPELLTVAVFDEIVFDALFPGPIRETIEGLTVEAIPFTKDNVTGYIDSPLTRHAAKACLQLAWQHRYELGL